ncbi:MAG: esterase [Devosia sp.]|uniref:alpha/beta hydrolase n=1 Tax=Devosia sp. TaxID=1871048 RepID=UPI0026081394|nr:hypothetical protein [Devosia sp.]MDB5528972.1 esterase [Devosia sp.]
MHFVLTPAETTKASLVLLHGSESDETTLGAFGAQIGPDRLRLALRGTVAHDRGYSFFRRFADRSLDTEDLRRRAGDLCDFLQAQRFARPPILVGFSNGAIMAAAILFMRRDLIASAVLMRPLSPFPGALFPPLDDCPVLMLDAQADARRNPDDAPHLAAQLASACAAVSRISLPGGHSLTDEDAVQTRRWLAPLA